MMKVWYLTSLLLILSSCGTKSEENKEGVQSAKQRNTENQGKSNGNMEDKVNMNKNLFDFQIKDINGKDYDLAQHKGKKILLVNTASECGLTPQYEQLEALFQEKGGDDFVIIGFPANNFGAQEPGTNQEIAQFCTKNYGVSFPMMSKISVKGNDIHPLYNWIVETERAQSGQSDFEIMWNFHKVLIDEAGNYVKQVHPQVLPTDEPILSWIDGK